MSSAPMHIDLRGEPPPGDGSGRAHALQALVGLIGLGMVAIVGLELGHNEPVRFVPSTLESAAPATDSETPALSPSSPQIRAPKASALGIPAPRVQTGAVSVVTGSNTEIKTTNTDGTTFEHVFASCTNNTAGVEVWIVEEAATSTTGGWGPFCDTCKGGASFPLGHGWARSVASPATLNCAFYDQVPAGGTASLAPRGGASFTGAVTDGTCAAPSLHGSDADTGLNTTATPAVQMCLNGASAFSISGTRNTSNSRMFECSGCTVDLSAPTGEQVVVNGDGASVIIAADAAAQATFSTTTATLSGDVVMTPAGGTNIPTGYDLFGTAGSASMQVGFASFGAPNNAVIRLVKYDGTQASPAAVGVNEDLGFLIFTGAHSAAINSTADGATIRARATENWTSSAFGTSIFFDTVRTGANVKTNRLTLAPTEAVFNDDSTAQNFRVETDANASAFLIDATAETATLGVPLSVQASGNTSGSTTANLWTSRVAATGGVDVAWALDTPAYANGDTLFSLRNNTSEKFKVAGNGDVTMSGTSLAGTGALTFSSGSGTNVTFAAGGTGNTVFQFNGSQIAFTTTGALAAGVNGTTDNGTSSFNWRDVWASRSIVNANSSAGQNFRIATNANASGEIGVSAGSNDTSTSSTPFAVCIDCDGTPTNVFTVGGNGDASVTGGLAVTGTIAGGGNIVTGASSALLAGTGGVQSSGGKLFPLVTKTSNYTMTAADYYVLCDTTSGAITLDMMTCGAGAKGRSFVVQKPNATANNCTIDPPSSDTINGAATLAWTTKDRAYTMVCDGAGNWFLTGQYN